MALLQLLQLLFFKETAVFTDHYLNGIGGKVRLGSSLLHHDRTRLTKRYRGASRKQVLHAAVYLGIHFTAEGVHTFKNILTAHNRRNNILRPYIGNPKTITGLLGDIAASVVKTDTRTGGNENIILTHYILHTLFGKIHYRAFVPH